MIRAAEPPLAKGFSARMCSTGMSPAGPHMHLGTGHSDTDAPVRPSVTRAFPRARLELERPRLHKVILLNDDYTPRDFVVTVLKAEFRMSEDQAHGVMMTAHRLGACVVAVFTRDVAETKATRATDLARAQGFPLMFTTEPEE